MKTLVIAEKADVAKQNYLPLLERVSGERFSSRSGYFESDSYYLTWFIGHLLESLMPDEYDEKFRNWNIEDLPIIPEVLLTKVKSDREKQARTIVDLAGQSSQIICGTDADREGQRIFTSFMEHFEIRKPAKRLWPSPSYADDDLDASWTKMKDMEQWKGWSDAADMRNETDWLIGMNATRAYSSLARSKLPIGRVQTATLALVVERDGQVENYRESIYYMIKASWGGLPFTYYKDKEKKFENEEYCRNKVDQIIGSLFALDNFQKSEKTENPPRPFSQPELQIEADKKFGFSAMKTLEISQSLYEKKVTTYPRTDSSNLPRSDFGKYRGLVDKYAESGEKDYLLPVSEVPQFFIEKEEPHSALTPTSQDPSGLGEDEAKIYKLIRDRFVLSFMHPSKYVQYEISITDQDDNMLKTVVRKTTAPGFKSFVTPEKTESEDSDMDQLEEIDVDEQKLRNLSGPLTKPAVEKIKRSKPKYFTQGTLLIAMKNCGKRLEDEEDRKIMVEKEHPGIGTPATQAPTIQQILDHQYVRMEKNKIISTPKGRKLIACISPDLKTPALTAKWEMKMKYVQDQVLSVEEYRSELHQYIENIVREAKDRRSQIDRIAGEKTTFRCPSCGESIIKKTWGYRCENEQCEFSIPYKILQKSISDSQIESLLNTSETPLIKGFRNSAGKTFDAKLVIKEKEGKKSIGFAFDTIACPKCKAPTIRIFAWGAGCMEREKCGFKVWREVAKKKLSDSQLRKLMLEGKTAPIRAFKNRNGKEFDARLVLDEEQNVKFEFDKK